LAWYLKVRVNEPMLTKFLTVTGTTTAPGAVVAFVTIPAVVTGAVSANTLSVIQQRIRSRNWSDLSPALPLEGRWRWFQN